MSVMASQVQKVMRASVWARRISTFLIALVLAGMTFALYIIFKAPGDPTVKISLGTYVFTSKALQSIAVKVWVAGFILAIAALALGFIYLLRSVFARLATGDIFCATNVRSIRNLGVLLIVSGVFGWLLPVLNAAYFMYVGHAGIQFQNPPLGNMLGPFIHGGLLILLSWIMAVGLGVREDAEELRRDAELVI